VNLGEDSVHHHLFQTCLANQILPLGQLAGKSGKVDMTTLSMSEENRKGIWRSMKVQQNPRVDEDLLSRFHHQNSLIK